MGPRLTLLSSPPARDEENCYIDTPVGVAAVLRALATAGARAVVYFDDGTTFLHSSIVGVEDRPPGFLFEKSPEARLNMRLVNTEEATLVTADRGVPVQFRFKKPEVTPHEDGEAFRASLPEKVLRLQRRGYYRLPARSINALVRCQIVRADDADKILRPTVVDLSCGGMALDIPVSQGLLDHGTRHICSIEFPGLGRIDTPLLVHTSREIALPGGTTGRRYGVEFLNLEVKGVALIQRFINDEERRLIRSGRS
jgi:c-di-GMP-binding flagellar brake protein YcgR